MLIKPKKNQSQTNPDDKHTPKSNSLGPNCFLWINKLTETGKQV